MLRTGDQIEIPVTVFNKSSSEVKGQIELLLMNAATGTSVDGWLQNVFPVQHFSVSTSDSARLRFPIAIPSEVSFEKLIYKIVSGKDTLLSGTCEIEKEKQGVDIIPQLSYRLQVFVIRNNEKIPLTSSTDVFVGDTLQLEYNYVAKKKPSTFHFAYQFPANTREIPTDSKLKRNNALSGSVWKLVVTHAGKCRTDGIEVYFFKKYYWKNPFEIRSVER
jgi:hypothetical protein